MKIYNFTNTFSDTAPRSKVKLVRTKKEKSRAKMPDFMARLKQDFGDQVFPDSQPIFDELREDAGSISHKRTQRTQRLQK